MLFGLSFGSEIENMNSFGGVRKILITTRSTHFEEKINLIVHLVSTFLKMPKKKFRKKKKFECLAKKLQVSTNSNVNFFNLT